MIALNSDWAVKQMEKYEAHYKEEAPKRTDEGDAAAPLLGPIFPISEEYQMTHEEMRRILINQIGVKCWGCNFAPPGGDERHLELDHINPQSEGGRNDLDNRALLCGPCNRRKSNTMTLTGLRRANKRDNYLITIESVINIREAIAWSREHFDNWKKQVPHQLNLEGR